MLDKKNIREYERGNVPKAGNPARNEAWALIEAARRIASVIRFGDFSKPEDKRRMREALRLNLRIWTIIQAELSGGDSPLPEPLRINILTLCKFIDNHTVQTMLEPTPERAATLIDINRNIAAGLLGSTSDEIAAETEPTEEDARAMTEGDTGKKPSGLNLDI